MPSDTLIVLVFAVLLMVSLGLLQIWLWRQDRALAALGIWGGALVVGATGFAMAAARGRLPDRVSIDLAVVLVATSYGLAWAGARRLEGRTIPVPVVLGGAIVWLLACLIPDFHAFMPARIAMASCLFGVYDLLTMREFLRERRGPPLPSRHALGVTFGLASALQVLRVSMVLVRGTGHDLAGLPSSPWLTVSSMAAVVLVACTSVLLISVAKEEAEQRAITTLAAARDTADRANAAKSRFLARMSHELRTPLNGVLGMSQALVRDPMLRGGQRQRAILLEQAGRHLLAIVNDLLAVASVEADRFELAPRPTLVRDIVRGGMDLVAATALARQVTLDLDVGPEVPAAVLADPVRVRQIIVNLLGNAIKFAPRGGRVELAVTCQDGLGLSVTDTGPGVPADIVPHLFEDFTQHPVATRPANTRPANTRPANTRAADTRPVDTRRVAVGSVGSGQGGAGWGAEGQGIESPDTESAIEGTGLGLAISASLARAMGGTISYRPGPQGTGSVFSVVLPLPEVEPPPSRQDQPADVASVRSDLTVLVVDDVASNRKVAEAFLLPAGITVRAADDGATALDMLRQGTVPDLILMDVYMPGLDGLAATRAIRALPGAAGAVPIIALTADISLDRADACRDAGMNGYLTKPLDLGELFAAIAEAIPGAVVPARHMWVSSSADR